MPTESNITIAQQISFIKDAIDIVNQDKHTIVMDKKHSRILTSIHESLLVINLVEHAFESEITVDESELIAQKYDKLLAACNKLINAPHYEHFGVRLNDHEMQGLDAIKEIVAREAAAIVNADQTKLEFEKDEEVINDEITGDYDRNEEAERMYRIQRELK